MKKGKRAANLLGSFRIRVTVVLVLALLAMVGLSNLLIYRFSLQAQMLQLRERLMAIAQTAAVSVDVDALAQVPLQRAGVGTPEYRKVAEQLLKVKRAAPSIKYVYTLGPTRTKGQLQFIVDPEPSSGKGRLRSPSSYPGDPYNASRFPEMLRGFSGPAADQQIMVDEWGATLSGYAPLRDSSGKVVAILGVDMLADDVRVLQRQVGQRMLLVLMIGLVGAVVLGVAISYRLTSRLEKLVQATRRIAADDLDVKVDVKGHDEISELAGSFNYMASSLSRSRKRLHEYFYRAVQSLVRILEAKDAYTKGHSERVAEYSRRIGIQLGFSPQRVDLLEKAAELHDIGKLVIHESILNKPGKLSDEEWKIIREHPVIGEEVLKPVLVDEALLAVVRAHHERYDGKGYPDSMRGDHIDMFAQIISVADAFDAMTSPRSYRPAMSRDAAVVELKKNAGTQFNPEVVKAFLAILEP